MLHNGEREMWPHNREETSRTHNTSHSSPCPSFPFALTALLAHSRALLSYTLEAGGSRWCGGRMTRGRGLTLVSRSSSRVSSLFWAARPSWSSLTMRMMWFQLNSLIRSNHTWAWWEYGGTVRRKDRWMLCTEERQLKRGDPVGSGDSSPSEDLGVLRACASTSA